MQYIDNNCREIAEEKMPNWWGRQNGPSQYIRESHAFAKTSQIVESNDIKSGMWRRISRSYRRRSVEVMNMTISRDMREQTESGILEGTLKKGQKTDGNQFSGKITTLDGDGQVGGKCHANAAKRDCEESKIVTQRPVSTPQATSDSRKLCKRESTASRSWVGKWKPLYWAWAKSNLQHTRHTNKNKQGEKKTFKEKKGINLEAKKKNI